MLSASLYLPRLAATGLASTAVAASSPPASKIPSVRRFIFSAIPGAQITILSLVALITKNVHCSWSLMMHRNRRLAPLGTQPGLRGSRERRVPEPVAIKTKLAFDGLRMIKSLIGIPALLGDT
jgi:hypothetical protein